MHIHFIAIGGSAMHNLALALQKKGYHITGSDDSIHEPSRSRLAAAGLLPPETGWFPEKITAKIDAVILGMHAHADNAELKRAKELGLKIYSYPEYLYELSKNKTRVVIGGSHGKTTITSMILHVLHYYNIEVDYMVGAQLKGFENMVHITDYNDFIVLEGDEYLSSTLDKRPKFHLYKPHIALLSGIAWDHINVFPTFDNYVEQFKIFIDSIEQGGVLIYNEKDTVLTELVEKTKNVIKKIPYHKIDFKIEDHQTFLITTEGKIPLQVFGTHNMQNLAGALWICQLLGVQEEAFHEAIISFTGADKRLEILAQNNNSTLIKDFAHAPSKVKASVKAVKEQFPNQKLIVCLELHTYSSLNKEFLAEYAHSLDDADEAYVFYSPKAVAIKRLEAIDPTTIKNAFQNEQLKVYTEPEKFTAQLYQMSFKNTALLLMSSGNYGGLDLGRIKLNFV